MPIAPSQPSRTVRWPGRGVRPDRTIAVCPVQREVTSTPLGLVSKRSRADGGLRGPLQWHRPIEEVRKFCAFVTCQTVAANSS